MFDKLRQAKSGVLIVSSLAVFTDMVIYGVIMPIMKEIIEKYPEFKDDEDALVIVQGALPAVYAAGLLIFTPVFGSFSDRYKTRKIPMLLGQALLAISTLMFAFAQTFAICLIARFLQGIAGAATWVVGMAMLVDVFDGPDLGFYMGIVFSFHNLGFFLGPLIGGFLHDNFGLNSPFYVCTALALIDLIGRLWIKEPKASGPIINGGDRQPVVGLTMLQLIRKPEVFLLSVVMVLRAASFASLESMLEVHLNSHFGYTPSQTSLVFLAFILPSIVSVTVIGWLSGRVKRYLLITIGLALHPIAAPMITSTKSVPLIIVGGIIFGVTTSFASSPVSPEFAEIVKSFGGASYARIYGLLNISYSFGILVGPSIVGFITEKTSFRFAMITLTSLTLIYSPIFYTFMKRLYESRLVRLGLLDKRPLIKFNPKMNSKLSIEDICVKDKQILVRVDYNAPLENGKVADSTRIAASIPTLRYLLNSGATKIVLISHLGRPDGKRNENLSLRPVIIELEKLLGEAVKFIPECVGESVVSECNNASEKVILLENLRFHVEEEGQCKNKDGTVINASFEQIELFRSELSKLGHIYVNDAFGTVHRAHSSISGISIEPRVAGFLVKKELNFFSKVLEGPEKIHTLILGGAKVSDKILLIEHMLSRVENVIIGGGMAFTFLHVLCQMKIGKSLFDEKGAGIIVQIMKKADEHGVKIHLPIDFVEGDGFSENARFRIVEENISADWLGLDIGPKSCGIFSQIINQAPDKSVILWNGPMGVFEWENFSKGTVAILESIVNATGRGCVTIVGGGDSAAAVSKWNCEKKVSHVSTGGGASLELLEASHRQDRPKMSDELIVIGSPFPSIENDNKDYIPVWKQKAVSSKGTKRFHGAFEGGFSAGYFNSVGTKEGWKPSEFISSRDKKINYDGKIENFMDEDDQIEFNSKDIVFIGSQKDSLLNKIMQTANCHDVRSSSDDPLLLILSLCSVDTDQNIVTGQSKSKTESEAFSGGGAWDEDDERIEIYENKSSLHMASSRIESSDKVSDEILSLAFVNSSSVSDMIAYPAPSIPSDYLPIKLADESILPLYQSDSLRFPEKSILESQDKTYLADVDVKTASSALKGFMPFGEDPDKQERYVKYLRSCKNNGKPSVNALKNLFLDEKEREEFIMSAQIFKPSSSMISSRFESSTQLQPQIQLKAGLSRPYLSKKLIINHQPKVETSSVLKKDVCQKRLEYVWVPNTLLCKRFNVSPPDTGLATAVEFKKVKPVLADEFIVKLVDTLVNESKYKIQFEIGKSNGHENNEECIPHMLADDLFDEIFSHNPDESQTKTRTKAIDYFD